MLKRFCLLKTFSLLFLSPDIKHPQRALFSRWKGTHSVAEGEKEKIMNKLLRILFIFLFILLVFRPRQPQNEFVFNRKINGLSLHSASVDAFKHRVRLWVPCGVWLFVCRRDNIYFQFCAAVVCQRKNAPRHRFYFDGFFFSAPLCLVIPGLMFPAILVRLNRWK